MDKVKAFIAKLWKQRFWVLTGTVCFLGMVFLFLATNHLQGVTTGRNSDIESAESDLRRLSSIVNHPNEEFHKEQEEINSSIETAVRISWLEKWEDQKEILEWPEELGRAFLAIVEPLSPIERNFSLTPDPDWKEPLRVHQRESYADYISEELPDLAETVRSVWHVADSTTEIRRSEEDLGMVHWDPGNQQEILDKYFQWPMRRNSQPTTLDVLYAQEDLWVLKALTQIIAETNRVSDARHNLIIKDINFIQIGRLAGVPAGDIVFLAPTAEGDDSRAPGMEGPGAFGTQPGFGGEGVLPGSEGSGMEMGRGGIAGGDGQIHPAEGRYVDKNYLPLPAQQLWDARESNEAETAYLAVAKRMPIRMGLTMDQREINRLLIACGNSPLTVEVRQVRINPNSSGSSAGAAPRGGTGRERDAGSPMGAQGAGSNDEAIGTYDVPIEIYGIIYVFNPVDRAKLRPEEIGSETEVEGAAPEQPPADQNPVPEEGDGEEGPDQPSPSTAETENGT